MISTLISPKMYHMYHHLRRKLKNMLKVRQHLNWVSYGRSKEVRKSNYWLPKLCERVDMSLFNIAGIWKENPPTGRGFSTLLWALIAKNTGKDSKFWSKIGCAIALCITIRNFRARTHLHEYLWAVFWKIAISSSFFSNLQFSARHLGSIM